VQKNQNNRQTLPILKTLAGVLVGQVARITITFGMIQKTIKIIILYQALHFSVR